LADGSPSAGSEQPESTRVWLVLITVFAFGAALLLSAVRVPRVSVLMTVVSDEVSLQMANAWTLYDFPLRELGAANAKRIEIPDGSVASRSGASNEGRALTLVGKPDASTWSARLASDYLQMRLETPADAAMRMKFDGASSAALQLSISGSEPAVALDTDVTLRVQCTSCLMVGPDGAAVPLTAPDGEAVKVTLDRRTVSLLGGELPLLLSLGLQKDGQEVRHLTVGAPLRAKKVGFTRVEAGLPVSTISGSGSIAFPGLEIDPLPLEPGDFIEVETAGTLAVRRISLGEAIEVELQGAVKDLHVGPSGALRPRKPTLLEYIYGNSVLQLVIGATLTLGGAITGALYRLGYLRKGGK